jgi:hypothetical protein
LDCIQNLLRKDCGAFVIMICVECQRINLLTIGRTNLDSAPVMGKTITTGTQTGFFLVALLAAFSKIGTTSQCLDATSMLSFDRTNSDDRVGTAHLWHLLAFAYHQAHTDGRPMDALFRQQQALLRTLPSPSSVMADAVKLW